MTLRWLRLLVLPITGPRSRGSARPQRMGMTPSAPSTGCEVRRMCLAGVVSVPMSETIQLCSVWRFQLLQLPHKAVQERALDERQRTAAADDDPGPPLGDRGIV